MIRDSSLSSRITKDINLVAQKLIDTQIVGFPTESVYAVGCLYGHSLEELHKLKQRSASKPFLFLAKDIDQVSDYVEKLTDFQKDILQKYWPGPVTFILSKKKTLSYPQGETIAFRVPDNKFLSTLLSLLNAPLAAPSANPKGMKPAYSAEEVLEYFPNIDVYDGGVINDNVSTIVDISGEKPVIVRKGKIEFNGEGENINC